MDVLLINPNSRLISSSWGYKRFFNPIAPLGLCYMAAVLRDHGIETHVIDHYATGSTDRDIVDVVKKEKPFLIGFSALTTVMPDIRRLVQQIRLSAVKTKIVLGNIHATCFPEEVLKDRAADIVVRGEGELTMLELCKCLTQKGNLENVAGISFYTEEGIKHNPNRQLINDLDTLPYPAWDLLDLSSYESVPLAAIANSLTISILASRGCPYKCYYCSQDTIYDRVRYRDLEKVVNEMEYFNGKFGIKYFGFCDAYFPFNERSGLEFCDLIMKRSLQRRVSWCTETRVDKVTPRLLQAMKQSGAHLIMYGVEVGNEQILNSINKEATLEQARIAFRETRKAGILSLGLFILGLPGETVETCRQTVRFAKSLDCDIVKFNTAVPYPGSRFFNDFIGDRVITDHEKFTSWYSWTPGAKSFVYHPEAINDKTLRYLQNKAMIEFYLRPKVIFRHIRRHMTSPKNLFLGFIWLVLSFLKGVFKKKS